MIHRQTFKDINQQITNQPKYVPEILSSFLNLNQSEIPTVINFNTSSVDAMNDLWWIQRLANRRSLPDDGVSTETIIEHLDRIQMEYWFQLQKLCQNSGFLSMDSFNQVLWSHQQEVTQSDVNDPYGMQPFYSFWSQFGESISVIMDNDDQYQYLDQFFKTQSNDAMVDNNIINNVIAAFNTLKYRYSAKVVYLNNAYGDYRVPRINFTQCRQRLELVHDEFKQTLQSLFNVAGEVIKKSINEDSGADPSQVRSLEALFDIGNGLIPIDNNDAASFKSVLIGFDNMHKSFLYQQIKRLEQRSFLGVSDFQPNFEHWNNCQTTEQRSDLSVFYRFFKQHRDELFFLTFDFSNFKFVNDFMLKHEHDYQHVSISDALALHDQFLVMKDFYLATVDVVKNL